MNKNLTKARSLTAAIITFGSLVTGAHASTTAFTFDNTIGAFADGLNNGDTITQDGITITFSDVVITNGSSFGDVEGEGILLSSSTDPSNSDVKSFSISFSERVQILTYDIGGRGDVPSGRFFTLVGSNGTSGNNSIPAIVGSTTTEVQLNFDAGAIPFLEANQAYSFTHNLPSTLDDPLFNLEELRVQAVPEPSSLLLIGLGTLSVLSRRKRVQ